MVKSVIDGVTTLYISAAYQIKAGVVTKYYMAGAQVVAIRKGTDLSYLLSDHLGSTSISVNATTGAKTELRYKAWGEVRYTSGTTPTDQTYTGQRSFASDFGLMYYNARWYDSSLGRFAQADNIEVKVGSTEPLDRFAYVLNNPILHNDPSGHNVPCAFSKTCPDPGVKVPGWLGWIAVIGCALQGTCISTPIQGTDEWQVKTNPFIKALTAMPFTPLAVEGAVESAAAEGVEGLAAAAESALAGSLGETGTSGYGGSFLNPNDEVAIFAQQKGASTFKTFDPMGNSAQSLSVAGSPEEAFSSAFNRPPVAGEPYWKTTAGQIGSTGRFLYLDAQGSPGHISIYGGDPAFRSIGEFAKIWTQFFFGGN